MTLSFSAAFRLGAFAYEATFEADREIVVLFGHSGAGKSLTLRCIAGLLRPDNGRITLDGTVLFDREAGIDLPPQARNVGYVVQDLALFPHLTVAKNVRFGMARGKGQDARVAALLDQFGLTGMEDRLPRTLSGGQQQRVALARALAHDSRLLLLDEPFSALDESLRSSLRHELLRLRADLGLTIVFVTHDLREAHLLADRLAVFDAGRILQFGDREAVFRQPASRRVAELTGVANVFRGAVQHLGTGCVSVRVDDLELTCRVPGGAAFSPGDAVDVAIRAERVNLRRTGADATGPNMFRARIEEEFAYGATHSLRLQPVASGPAVEVEIASRPYEVLGISTQKEWVVELPPGDLHVMSAP